MSVPNESYSIPYKLSDVVSNTVLSGMEFLSKMSLGQGVLKLFDRTLWVVEKTTQWSLPIKESCDENGTVFGTVELVKPLPWVLFLPTLFILRVTRFAVNIGLILIGHPKIEPNDVVDMVQKARRRVRSIKSQGLRTIREKSVEPVDKAEIIRKTRMTLFQSIQFTISTLFCLGGNKLSNSPPPTRIFVGSLQEVEASKEESIDEIQSEHIKRKHEETVSADESGEEEEFMVKLNHYAEEDSADDEEYTPEDKDSSTSEDETSPSEQEISVTEVQNLINDTKESVVNSEPSPGRVNSVERYPRAKNEIDGDFTYYSPISSTSDSPERSGTPNKLARDFGRPEEKSEGNGKLLVAASVDLEKSLCSDDGTNDNVKNGQNEEKRHGKGNKGNHKSKKSHNSTSRKKK